MNELVILKNRQAVTTSLKVAEIFGKEHRNVIQAIENKIHSAENSAQYQNMFVLGTYKDASGKQNKMYYMNRDGFTFIAFGFTGAKADEFKLKYIQAFNRMEAYIQQQVQLPQTPEEKIDLLLESSHRTSERIHTLEDTVDDIKNRMGLPGNEAHQFTTARAKKVIITLGGKDSNAYQNKQLRKKTFTALFASFKHAFDLDRYNDTPMARFDEALDFIRNWYPPFELEQEIQASNAQTNLI